jgi:transcriptional regulator with XRE-family HTH domain
LQQFEDDFAAILGAELRKAQIAAGLTQKRLAFAAGVDSTYISQLENDKRLPTLQILFRLYDALDVSAGTIVSRVDKARRRPKR